MSLSLLFSCCQIETCARDLDAVRDFLVGVLGGVPAEQELARQIAALIPGDAYDVDHIDCGKAIFQINRPSPAMAYNGNDSVHQRYLDERGPCVTNLNFFVDDIAHAREWLTSLGAPTLIEGPSSAARALAEYGPDNTRPGADARPFLFMGTRSLIGLDLEILEPNFLRFSEQNAQFPAFIEPRPDRSDLTLHRLIVAVPDLAAAWTNLTKVFAPASRSKPYGVRKGLHGSAFRVGLGGIEIEFCAPQASAGEISQFLATTGTGVMAIAFGAADVEPILDRSAARGFATERRRTDLLGDDTEARCWTIASRSVAGFDVLLEDPESFFA